MEFVGEWWKADTEAVINQAMQTGGAPNISDAFTFNGLPGPSYNCSAEGMLQIHAYYFLESRTSNLLIYVMCFI